MITPAATPFAAGHGLLRSVSTVSSRSSLPPERRGRLRNGARPGDFLAAPRCDARTRSGCSCRQPAMANGRCRMHGGLSTGPRTPEGRERCARARRKHGAYSAAARALLVEARARFRRSRALRARLTQMPGAGRSPGATAGHEVLRQYPSVAHKGERRSPLRYRSVWMTPFTAGHGLLRSDSKPVAVAPAPIAPMTLSSPRARRLLAGTALSAGHGVLRSNPALVAQAVAP